ncbi:tetratricopeptide repeat protein [Novosphingobium sp. 1949]|uniref:Tetratricopeptide repeat protein n=1 Tax=Novosphingobium organovorum TaxID=2930092 RepID=A0ABT0B9A3_9SPHN|nr:tetratricopeptide repeat protein [Novosphingobium organovorum]MCJ2181603.1 tetratricopeptide repeat protein [Novosphingobium organovorum]
MDATNPISGPNSLQPVRRVGLAALGLALGLGVFSLPAAARDAALIEPGARAAHPTALIHTPLASPDLKADLDKGFARLRKGDSEKAVSYFDRVIAAADSYLANDPRPRRCIATARRDGEAARVAQAGEVVAIDDALCDAHFGRGFALIDLGRGDLAEADLRAATEMAPSDAHFANEYAELYKSRRDWPQAYALFERAWKMSDQTMGGPNADMAARALRGMGYAAEKMGHLDEARTLLQKSLAFEPDSEAGRVQLSHVERMQAIGS